MRSHLVLIVNIKRVIKLNINHLSTLFSIESCNKINGPNKIIIAQKIMCRLNFYFSKDKVIKVTLLKYSPVFVESFCFTQAFLT